MAAQFEMDKEQLEMEKESAVQRAGIAEQRCAELEQQLSETVQTAEQQFAEQGEASHAREEQLLEKNRAQEAAMKQAAAAAAQIRTALESEKTSLTSRLEETSARLPPLQEHIRQLEAQRNAESEKARDLAEKLAQALAEKKGLEELKAQAQKQTESIANLKEDSSRSTMQNVQSQLESAVSRLRPAEEARDAALAESAAAATKLAGAKAECAALAERIPALERRLVDEVEAVRLRLATAEAAKDDAHRLREESLAALPPLHERIAELSAEKAALAALVPKLESRLNEEQAIERERTDKHIARADAHAAEARKQRDLASSEARDLREEIKVEAAASATREERLQERVTALQLDQPLWPLKLEASEARLPPLLEELRQVREEKNALVPQLATLGAEKRGLEEMIKRTEAWGEQQTKELRAAIAASHARLEAAAAERIALLEQKEAAALGWHRAQEALAASQAEKRAAEEARLPMERALETERARVAKLEAELRALGTSARSACTRVEEMSALHTRTAGVESAVEMQIDRERTKLAAVLASERERSQTFVEATFLQQHALVEQQQAQLRKQQQFSEEARAQQQAYEQRVAAENEAREVSRIAVDAALAGREARDDPPVREAATHEARDYSRDRDSYLRDAAGLSPENHISSAHMRKASPEDSVSRLLELQDEIRRGAADVQGALRHKHFEHVLGAYETAYLGPCISGAPATERPTPRPLPEHAYFSARSVGAPDYDYDAPWTQVPVAGPRGAARGDSEYAEALTGTGLT